MNKGENYTFIIANENGAFLGLKIIYLINIRR